MKKTIILDFDGTIVESVDIKTEAFGDMFHDHPRAKEIVAYHLKNNGVSRFVKLQYIYENYLGKPFDDAARTRAGRQFSDIVLSKVIGCPFVPGAERFLREFSDACPLFLVSATPHEELTKIVAARGLSGYFAGVFGSPPGSKAGHVAEILRTRSASAEEAVYVGDSLEDMRAARQAGVEFLARRNKEDFGDTKMQFNDMAEISNYLRQSVVFSEVARKGE